MIEFFQGFVVGIIFTFLFIIVLAKPLMKWFAKRQMKRFAGDVIQNVSGLATSFQQNIKNGENKDGT